MESVSKSRRVDGTKCPRLHLLKENCMSGTTSDVRSILHTGAKNTPIESMQLGWHEIILEAHQNTQPLRSLFRKRIYVIFPKKITRKRNTKNIKNR